MPRRSPPLIDLLKQMVSEPLSQYSDRQLLARFADNGDEKAFAAIVDRHSPMLLALCRRQLSDDHLAEDVLQATFLVLARKARSIRRRESLADWLFGVAQRLARQTRLANSARSRREQQAAMQREEIAAADPGWETLLRVLDDELQRLPPRYRSPLLLCYLEGRTQDEAAKQLGLGLNTVRRRLERGRELLRARMTSRGATLGAVLFAGFLAPSAARAALTAELRKAVVAMAKVGGNGVVISTSVMALANGAMRMSIIAKVILWASAAVAASGMAAGAVWQLGAGSQAVQPRTQLLQPEKKLAIVPTDEQVKEPVAGRDLFGDLLPEGALARLGTVAFRHGPIRASGFRANAIQQITGPDNKPRLIGVFGQIPNLGEFSLIFTRDGKYLVSTGGGWLNRWEIATGRSTRTYGDGGRQDNWVGFEIFTTADGKVAYGSDLGLEAASDELRCTEYQLESGKTRSFVLEYPRAQPAQQPGKSYRPSVGLPHYVSPDGKFLAGVIFDGVNVWNASDGTYARHITAPGQPGMQGKGVPVKGPIVRFTALAFTPDSNNVVVGDDKNTLRVFELATGKEQRSFGSAKDGAINRMAISPDGKWLATTSKGALKKKAVVPQTAGQVLSVWNIAAGKVLHTFDLPIGFSPESLLFTPNSGMLIAGMRRNLYPAPSFSAAVSIQTWDLASGKPGRAWTDDPTVGPIPAVSPDGKTMATLSDYGVIRLWDMNSAKEIRPQQASPCSVNEVCFQADGKIILTRGADHTLGEWDVATAKLLGPPRKLTTGAITSFLAAGRFLELRQPSNDGFTTQLFQVASGKILLEEKQAMFVVSPDNKRAAIFELEMATLWIRSIRIVEIETGKTIKTIELLAKEHHPKSWTFTPDGRCLVLATTSSMSVWDVETGKQKSAVLIPRMKKDPGKPNKISGLAGVAVSPDGSKTAVSFWHRVNTGTVQEMRDISADILIVETATGKLLQQMHVDEELELLGLTFSPDGKHLAVGGFGTVRLWEVGVEKAVRQFNGHRGQITSLAFSPDGKRLASAGDDSTVLVWDVEKR